MVVLDRVFMNASWEAHFPLVTAHSITRIRLRRSLRGWNNNWEVI
ncbi:hypothetical protein SORBI_3004G007166 [Sorghum bicolor]|uniref:Uncharacterized protein n=1 Tax=Sorghum bicolor TaxID=4558 RepID=A0A1Z5RKC8_SORBI|nr:hypothetical protein SORBI_3004G007166 [Sorghum bicolor]